MSRPEQVTREVSPCKDCEDRHIACHDRCDNYKKWKQRIDEIKKAKKEYECSRYNKYRRD
jgi:hypothetical protein